MSSVPSYAFWYPLANWHAADGRTSRRTYLHRMNRVPRTVAAAIAHRAWVNRRRPVADIRTCTIRTYALCSKRA
jgi:hypothetical protein